MWHTCLHVLFTHARRSNCVGYFYIVHFFFNIEVSIHNSLYFPIKLKEMRTFDIKENLECWFRWPYGPSNSALSIKVAYIHYRLNSTRYTCMYTVHYILCMYMTCTDTYVCMYMYIYMQLYVMSLFSVRTNKGKKFEV